jgi:hypothetical protein
MPGGGRPRCSDCDRPGNGRCATCHGSGTNLRLNSPDPLCRRCKGTGVCPSCDGSGYPRSTELFSGMVTPGVPRSTVTSSGGLLEVLIPIPKAWAVIAFLPIWLVGWAFGERSAGADALHGKGSLFLYVWLAAWTAGGVGAVFSLFWMLAGRERITLDGSRVSIRYEIGPFGRTRRFGVNTIRNLRCSPILVTRSSLVAPGTIAFDYGAKTYRFGAGIDEAEANDLVRQMKERLPVA